ncbi:MAG: hypothetical protein ACJAV2_003905 [Myxococcota bacterium]|jgi:hypothetical protein
MNTRTLAISSMLFWMACSNLFRIRISDESITTVDSGTLVEQFAGDIGFGEFVSMDLTSSAELANQGVEPGDISEVFMENLELEAVSPTGGDLSFIDSVDVYVEAPDLPRVLIASQDDFPEGQALVTFTLEDVDLTDYVVSESMTFDTDVSGNRPDQSTDIAARFTVAIGVTGKGACANATGNR